MKPFTLLGPALLFPPLTAMVAAAAQAQAPTAAPAAPSPVVQAPSSPAPPVAEWRALDAADTLVIDSTKGRIVVEMRPDLAPNHVQRIKTLTRQGYYNGSQFYRVLGFMAQTGDRGNKQFRSALPNMRNEVRFKLTPRLPYVSLASSPAGDFGFVGSAPVVIEPDPARPADQAPATGQGHALFCPGTAAFAHGPQLDSANSQFFLMRIPAPHLETQFTVWGRVVQGQEAVAALKNGVPPPDGADRMTRVRVMSDMPVAERPKLMVMDTRSPAFAAQAAAVMQAKGAAFSLCDVPVPVKAD